MVVGVILYLCNYPIFVHAVETKLSSKIFAQAMKTLTICHNYRIYHKYRIFMHAPGLVVGRGFYVISMNYLCYFREVFMLFAKKYQNHNLCVCVSRGGWNVGLGIGPTREERGLTWCKQTWNVGGRAGALQTDHRSCRLELPLPFGRTWLPIYILYI
jgi:hypothetical protein